jgi:hypothetical protein
MNIEVLQDYINAFTREVTDSGLKRDLDDYASSLPASQNNIVALREIAGNVLSVLDHIYSGDLPDNLGSLLPGDENPPFTAEPYDVTLRTLAEDKKIQQQDLFNQLSQFINKLRKQIQQNENDITKIKDFIRPYISEDVRRISEEDLAILSIVFKDQQTVHNLKQFSKTLATWNRELLIYHQLLKSESPKDIQLVEIQNGSIDCLINLNVDVALDLVELFKLGFYMFATYLSYKLMIKTIIDSYHGNKKLIKQEEEREKGLLDNIGIAIQKKIQAQHKEAKKLDKGVDGTAIPKKVEQVSKLVTSHIVKGNDIKLLALPEREETEEDEEDLVDEREDLREQSVAARRQFRLISPEAQQKLLEAYGTFKEESE